MQDINSVIKDIKENENIAEVLHLVINIIFLKKSLIGNFVSNTKIILTYFQWSRLPFISASGW